MAQASDLRHILEALKEMLVTMSSQVGQTTMNDNVNVNAIICHLFVSNVASGQHLFTA
jgi:hypothetical protein